MNLVLKKIFNPSLFLFLFALVLRTWNLEFLPNGFHVDELDAGYIGRYIFLHGGKDVYGNFLPLVFDKFGDFRPTGIFYLSGLSSFLFGVNEFAVRLPTAFFGALTVPALMYFVYGITKNKKVAYWSGVTLAVLPWHIVLSRATSEAVNGLLFMILGLGLFVRKKYISGFLALLLTYCFYHSFRIVVPLVLLSFVKSHGKTSLVYAGILFTLTAFLALGSGKGRLAQVAFWNNPILPNTFDLFINGDGPNNVAVARTFHNKLVIYGREFLTQYSSYFSPEFLFIRGGFPDRYVVPAQGVLLVIMSIGVLGFMQFSRFPVFLALLFASVLPAALTYEDAPNVHRAIIMILPLSILIGLGLSRLKNTHLALISLFILVETVYFWHQYSYHSAQYRPLYRQDGVKEMIRYVIDHQLEYDRVVIPEAGEHALYYAFYSDSFDVPFSYGLKTDRIGNVEFAQSGCPSAHYQGAGNILFVDEDGCRDAKGVILTEIFRKDSTKAYTIREVSNL